MLYKMNESTNKMIEMLQNQISKRDEVITSLKRENEIHSIVNKAQKRKYVIIMLLLSALLLIESGIVLYNLVF